MTSALALWRGPALQGLTGTAWFSAEARRLETLRVDALEEDFEVRLALGEHRELEPALRSALADNPFRERLWGQLMLALYRSGRQADALETFQEARRVLADELGLEPGPELRRLQEAILAQDPSIASVPGRPQTPWQPPCAVDVVRRPRGRARRVAALLHEHRLVTLIGPPGVGKSRLAVETARSLEHEFPDGIWLVDFARAGGADDAVRLLAHAVDVRGADPLARVTSRLRDAGALVVLDACEHVLEEAARIASTLLAECPRLRILATSREVLRVAGEVRTPVAPLGPQAVELFLARARAARPGFEPDADDVALAAEIVRRVDGLPLAIELAAARVHVLGLAELVSILERRAALLRDSPASDPGRTALQGLVEWSYDLLHGDEKTLLQQLAVHRGGASLTSLVAVAATHDLNEATVAYLVSALVDKSIVSAAFTGGAARYDMLDTVREYVLERLDESGGRAAVRGAHAEFFATLAERRGRRFAWPGMAGVGTPTGAGERQSLGRARVTRRTRPTLSVAVRLGTLGWYFALADRVSDGRRFLELSVSVTRDDAPLGLRVEQLAGLCYLVTEELDHDSALAAGERAFALAATAAAPWQQGFARLMLSLAVAQSGDAERAAELAGDAVAKFDASGDDWGVARPASSARSVRRKPGTSRRRQRLRRQRALIRTRSATRRFSCRRCSSRHGRRSDGRTARPRSRRTAARSRSRDASASATTRRSPLRGSGRTRLRRGTCARRRSSSGRRSSPPRRPMRRWSQRWRASSSGASRPRPAMPRALSGRTARSSSGRSCSGRTRRGRASSSRSPAARPRPPWPASRRSPRPLELASRRRRWQSVGTGVHEPSDCQ